MGQAGNRGDAPDERNRSLSQAVAIKSLQARGTDNEKVFPI